MPRVKVARKSTAIDMTAMCDVAFLLLTFFILTAKPKVDDPSKAEVPASSKEIQVPDDNILTIAIGKQTVNKTNPIFLSFSGNDVRVETLKTMGEIYHVDFTPAEQNRFANTELFGVPMNQMKSFLNTPTNDVAKFQQTGIPADTTNNNELSNWILNARKADRALHGKDYSIAIKGDRLQEYPVVNTVITVLGHQKLFKFDLITTLRKQAKK
ncbi:MAG: ExbD/TolR family protein [Mucilaginibacter sp.]|uniref:ExbD/TolR family protein n=1 Tax=Mucilaginibacter sp. L3T2-6 TaxID=3062491 RepID=UPI002674587D|nr:biopolymer transporter ExbD [Mucilaginibacter sp. L3T2-6]MDO3640721.1 biopolymer transporter ExbD [Mucilaginibacter sp. L3T2-6]MDV6212938.1 biopolymer transporter ExbD [Mucilaginibacter sp. L3T2-6]